MPIPPSPRTAILSAHKYNFVSEPGIHILDGAALTALLDAVRRACAASWSVRSNENKYLI
jgi:hypothetical protein